MKHLILLLLLFSNFSAAGVTLPSITLFGPSFQELKNTLAKKEDEVRTQDMQIQKLNTQVSDLQYAVDGNNKALSDEQRSWATSYVWCKTGVGRLFSSLSFCSNVLYSSQDWASSSDLKYINPAAYFFKTWFAILLLCVAIAFVFYIFLPVFFASYNFFKLLIEKSTASKAAQCLRAEIESASSELQRIQLMQNSSNELSQQIDSKNQRLRGVESQLISKNELSSALLEDIDEKQATLAHLNKLIDKKRMDEDF